MLKKRFTFLICLLCINWLLRSQQVQITDNLTPNQLIENFLISGCAEVSNVNSPINGSASNINSFGFFERGASNFPFQNGIVLSTGNVRSGGNTLNNNTLNEGSDNWGTDPDIATVLGNTSTVNATAISFNFTSISNQISFRYLLASEEYFADFPCFYSDAFGILIRPAGSGLPYTNIALIPDTTAPVNTTNIHPEIVGFCPADNEEYFFGYNVGDTNYNGRTTILTATANIIPNLEYEIKLVIADSNDFNYDSAVFIEANSFTASVDLGEDFSTCADSVVLNADVDKTLANYLWFLNDSLIIGENGATLSVNQSGNYRVEISIPINNSTCNFEDDINITLSSTQSATSVENLELCDVNGNGIQSFDLSMMEPQLIASVPPANYSISYHSSLEDAQSNSNAITTLYENSTNPQTIYARIEDNSTGCLAFNNFDLIVNALPQINQPSPLTLCDNNSVDGVVSVDLTVKNEEITTNNNFNISYHLNLPDAQNGTNPLTMPYNSNNSEEILFVRVLNSSTGCASITTLQLIIQATPNINLENFFIDACDTDLDGIASFNLNDISDEILQGLTGVTLSYHETLENAQDGTNAISNTSNYQNIQNNVQTVFIRVTNETTGCAAVRSFQIHTNLLLTGTNIRNFNACDEDDDGVEDFNLEDIEEIIANNLTDVSVNFYLTSEDRLNQVNALGTSYSASAPETQIYLEISSPTCTEYANIIFNVYPITTFESAGVIDVCDFNSDGLVTVNLSTTFNNAVTFGQEGFSVTYYLNETDAINNENRLPNNYRNTTNPYTLFTRITNQSTGCAFVNSFDVNVILPPESSRPSDILICDTDQDGIAFVDLTSVINELAPETTDLIFSFHLTNNNAIANVNSITNPENYETNTRTIYARTTSSTTGCGSIQPFNVVVNTLPVFPEISNEVVCTNNLDGIEDFIFQNKDAEILNGQNGKRVLYFETITDAENGTNPIDKTSAYQNTSSLQTIYVRVENISDTSCFGTSSFDIEVGILPIFNEPYNLSLCDDLANDGIEIFDLEALRNDIEIGSPDNLQVQFYLTEVDASNAQNAISTPTISNTTNPQTLFVRIDNDTSFCFVIREFSLRVIQIVNQLDNAPRIVGCDRDYDGITSFNLFEEVEELLDVRQENILLSFFETEADLINNTNAIPNPENYSNISNPQTLYFQITNIISGCFLDITVTLEVNTPPVVNNLSNFEICDNALNQFNLTNINSMLYENTSEVVVRYFSSFANAEANTNVLNNNYSYQSDGDELFARVAFTDTGCFFIQPFTLAVNPLPTANTPTDMQACDDSSEDGLALFNLFTQDTTILGVQDATLFSVSYYANTDDANTGTNALDSNYIGTNGQTIYARIENNLTGCFSLTQFSLIVNQFPNTPEPLEVCDNDYDGLNTFDLTQVEAGLFDLNNPDIVLSYFTSIDDLEADTNAIATPGTFQNTSNPQTIFIKIFNTVANCFNTVNLTLEVNLPPLINSIDQFDVCFNEENFANLQDFNSILLAQTENAVVSYYTSFADASNQTNPLADNFNYTADATNLFARVAFSTTGCFYIQPFTLLVNVLPVINNPSDLQACDDDFDGLLVFDLNIQTAGILGTQNPADFTVSYHPTPEDANFNTNALNTNYNGTNMEIIYVRVEDNVLGCFNTTQFKLIINPRPVVNIPTQVICLDIGFATISADTGNENDVYLWSTGQTTPVIEISEIGSYSVTVTSIFGCETTVNFDVIESEPANIEVVEVIDFSDPNNITITVNGIGNYAYALDGEAPQTSNVFENVTLGYHTITIIDLNGCEEVTHEVVVVDAPKFMTPNNDGYFDTWHISGVATLPGTMVNIFDRYGKLLTVLDSRSAGWDGNFKGQPMPTNDYWFVAKVVQGGRSFEVRGHFTLKR